MAKIVNMARVVREQVAFDMGDGRIFLVDDKLPVEQWLTLANLEQRMLECMADLGGNVPEDGEEHLDTAQEILAILEDLCAEILVILQVNNPELDRCPFDEDQVILFMNEMRLHFAQKIGPDPTPPSPTPAGTKTAPNRATRRKSTRSSGSPRSASNTAGRRTTGDA